MNSTRAIKSFPRRMATNDDFRYGLLVTLTSAVTAGALYLIIPAVAPAGIDAYASSYGTILAALAALASMRFTIRNASTNEQNRMSLNQQLRTTVRKDLMGQLTVDDANRLIAGKTIAARNDFNVWIKREGREAILMTDKLMGYKVYQTEV
jgi:hypothetical protein